MPWRFFFALVFVAYGAANLAFALGYWSLGDGIENAEPGSLRDAFFFSVQTLATIGYGKMAPRTLGANVMVSIEALLGMIGLAVTTGLVFARFSRPTARVLFSRVAVVAPYEGVPSLMFRMANARSSEIVEARLKLTLIRNERTAEGREVRRLSDLQLVRSEHSAFALTWTAVHPITPGTPLHGATPETMRASMSDLVVSLTGLDEGFSQTVHARYGYSVEDLRFGARFVDILTPGQDRSLVDYTRFHDVEPIEAAPEGAHAGGGSSAAGASP
jgi:inward rectifier potassium channel